MQKPSPSSEIAFVASLLGSIGANRRPNDDKIITAMRTIARQEFMSALLHSIKSDSALSAAVCERSYFHPLAFSKLVLMRDNETGSQVRLHVWSSALGTSEDEPHTHTRDFWSILLSGGLNIFDYEEVETGDAFLKYKTTGGEAFGGYAYEHIGSACVARVHSTELRFGGPDVHHLDYDQIHLVRPFAPARTVTLFLQGPERSKHSVVYSKIRDKPARKMFKPLEPHELGVAFRDAIEVAFGPGSQK